ncbi:hypothetical protein ACH4U6_34895 [Streptomyces netropsis]|uniref:hypothetical protein n=1 Tax=Streptomyces netropsis TaxID=55404 RepID=UPI003788AB42
MSTASARSRAPRAVASIAGCLSERRQRVRVPWHLVASPFYADVALSVYMKVKALGARPEGCTAGAERLASYLGMSKSSVERGLTQLRRPAPDGVVELPENVRRSLPGGSGTTARRRVRAMSPTERFVWLPVAACEDLTPRQLRAYAVLMYSQKQQIPLTLGEIAQYLRHHSGQRAGLPVTEKAAGAVIDELENTGWATVHRRAGVQGRHHYVAHEILSMAAEEHVPDPAGAPGEGAEDPQREAVAEPGCPEVGDGSGAEASDGSLATREDHRTVRPDDERPLFLPAVGEAQVEEAVENPAASLTAGSHRGQLALRAGNNSSPSTSGRTAAPARSAKTPYEGPELTFSPRVHAVLEPVESLVKQIGNVWVLRRIGREVGRQLTEGMDSDRLRHRLTARLAGVLMSEIRDPGRWILGVALPRRGCGHFDCESGVRWSTGEPCEVCQEAAAAQRAERQWQQRLDQGLCAEHSTPLNTGGHCHQCRPLARSVPPVQLAPRPREPQGAPQMSCRACAGGIPETEAARSDGLCGACRAPALGQLDDEVQEPEELRCAGWGGAPCDRLALPTRMVCLRHHAAALAASAAS